MAVCFVVSISHVLSSLVPFFYFIFNPILVQGLHCQFSSLVQVLGEAVDGKGEEGAATVQLQVPCTGCWKPSSFASDRYAAVCTGKE